jgi:hypothetical protein
MRKVLGLLAATAVAVGMLTMAVAASAHDGHGKDDGKNNGRKHDDARLVYSSALVGSLVGDPAIHGANAGGAPWVIDRGRARIGADGRISVVVRGLVIPVAHGTFPANTARPVTTVTASLYCGGDATTTAAATTKSVSISEDGDARITDKIALPATCLNPTVLVHPNGGAAAYIALPGWRS